MSFIRLWLTGSLQVRRLLSSTQSRRQRALHNQTRVDRRACQCLRFPGITSGTDRLPMGGKTGKVCQYLFQQNGLNRD